MGGINRTRDDRKWDADDAIGNRDIGNVKQVEESIDSSRVERTAMAYLQQVRHGQITEPKFMLEYFNDDKLDILFRKGINILTKRMIYLRHNGARVNIPESTTRLI